MARWPAHVTAILGGDLVVALGYRTPAGGVVVTPVTTLGVFDDEAGTVTTTTAFGNGRKLTRIERDGRVALLFHAREHSDASSPHTVLVQGDATFPDEPSTGWITPEFLAAWDRKLAPRKRGRFWDWVGREYYDARVPITVDVHRIVVWSDGQAHGAPEVLGAALPTAVPPRQDPPKNGTGPRVEAKRYAKRLQRTRHQLLGWAGADGYPVLVPAEVSREGDHLRVATPQLPDGGRRAGFLAHWFEERLLGQGSVLCTGWLDAEGGRGTYHPHTVAGYAMPNMGEVNFGLGAGIAAKAGHRKMVKDGRIRDGVWQRRVDA
jgi:hypothetical protein